MNTTSANKKTNVLVTVLVLALCIGIGTLVLPRLVGGELFTSYEAPLPGTGLWLTAGDLYAGEDKPEKAADYKEETESLLRWVRENRIGAIYWDVSLSEDYKDTLWHLCRKAKGSELSVYAVLPAMAGDALTDAESLAALMQEITQKAGITGFVLDASAVPAESRTALLALCRAAAESCGELPLGLVCAQEEGAALTLQDVQSLTADKTITQLLPVLFGTADAAYEARVQGWQSLTGTTVLPLAAPGFDAGEIGFQLYFNTTQSTPTGFVLGGYRRLAAEPATLQMMLSFAGSTATVPTGVVDLSIGSSLSVGYPESGATTYYSTIYIMGTSDPALPLTIDGEAVERTTASGCYGVEEKLYMGRNTFTVRQGEETLTIIVTRLSSEGGSGTISVVTGASRFPTSDAAVLAGEELSFRCVAPSGGSVTATIHGTKVAMEQKAYAKDGVAATYTGTYRVPDDLPEEELTNLGKITYTLTFGKTTTTYQSEGELYAAGAAVTPMVLATTENVSILSDYTDDSTILDTLHYGARIATTGCVQYNGAIYFAVAGGYISSARAAFYPEVVPGASTVTKITTDTEGRDTTVTFLCGNFPAVTGQRSEGTLSLFFRDTVLPEDLSGIKCDLISSVAATSAEGGTQLLLTFTGQAKLWGYDIQYNEAGDVTLALKEAPVLSTVPGKPLTGITVMVDPGHGNYDCGALGAAGSAGPTESELNLAIGLVVQQRLEQMGATVVMVRTTDDTAEQKVVLDERVSMAVDARPDFFLSIHHNSTALIKDVAANWMECYYYEESSLPFAQNLCLAMAKATGRSCSEAEWGYYYVTRLTLCPAVLFEVGFIPNPAQYEDCADWLTVQRTGCAMAEAILESIPVAPEATPEAS